MSTWGAMVIIDDFNGANATWGSRCTTERGHLLQEWLAERSLMNSNDGKVAIFSQKIKPTSGALRKVLKLVGEKIKTTLRMRRFVLLIPLDVTDVFNTVSWEVIMNTLD